MSTRDKCCEEHRIEVFAKSYILGPGAAHDEAFESGWDSALKNAPEVLALVNALNGIRNCSQVGTNKWTIANKALAAFGEKVTNE